MWAYWLTGRFHIPNLTFFTLDLSTSVKLRWGGGAATYCRCRWYGGVVDTGDKLKTDHHWEFSSNFEMDSMGWKNKKLKSSVSLPVRCNRSDEQYKEHFTIRYPYHTCLGILNFFKRQVGTVLNIKNTSVNSKTKMPKCFDECLMNLCTTKISKN